jgi:hypothetical protein
MHHFCPAAYEPDMPMSELRSAELLLAGAFRLYASERIDPKRRWPDWRQGFVAAGIAADGVPAFERLFEIVTAVPLRPLSVRCIHARFLAEDEGRLLQMVGQLQQGREEEAARLLEGWIPPAAVQLAMPALRGLAFAMQGGGLSVPPRKSTREPWPSSWDEFKVQTLH